MIGCLSFLYGPIIFFSTTCSQTPTTVVTNNIKVCDPKIIQNYLLHKGSESLGLNCEIEPRHAYLYAVLSIFINLYKS